MAGAALQVRKRHLSSNWESLESECTRCQPTATASTSQWPTSSRRGENSYACRRHPMVGVARFVLVAPAWTEVQPHACTLSLCIVVPYAYATEVAEPTARAIRGAVAARLRANREDFEPFMELEGLESGDGNGAYDACGYNRPF